jgi:hypothetical protein
MDPHREEFFHLAHVSHDRALITWGAFFFERDGDDHKLIDHEDLAKLAEPRARGCIGLETDGYGPATVRVARLTPTGGEAEAHDFAVPDGRNFAWATGLRPDATYRYEVTVRGKRWGAATSDFDGKGRKGRFTPSKRPYDNRFTTFPAPDGPAAPVTFAVLGDQGTGESDQYRLAERLEEVITREPVRFVITTGDNVYAQVKNKGLLGQIEKGVRILTKNLHSSGNEDDDWFRTFYLPYRRIINRVPVFPCLGNHDHAESENEADLAQHVDNFYLAERFPELAPRWKNTQGRIDTLFYRFRCGPGLEMAALDTSNPSTDPAFGHAQQKAFIGELQRNDARGWRIPFSHHPPFSVGPKHVHEPNVQNLANLFTQVDWFRLWLSGHEHNFQHHRIGQIHYIVSGASGKHDSGIDKMRVHPGASCCHSDRPHFLLVKADGPRLTIRAIGTDGRDIPRARLADLPPHPDAIEVTR